MLPNEARSWTPTETNNVYVDWKLFLVHTVFELPPLRGQTKAKQNKQEYRANFKFTFVFQSELD